MKDENGNELIDCPNCYALRTQLAACQRDARFPLLDGPTVPWKAVEVHERQALKNHGQTVKRLAERGGLSCAEFWFVMQDKDWEHGTFKEAERLGRELANKLSSDFDRAESAEQQLQQMREALKKYGRHFGTCKVYAPNRGGSAYDADSESSCDCGLNAARGKEK